MESIIMMAVIVVVCTACLAVKIAVAVRRARKHRRKEVVIARIKAEKDGVWICKFFLCGDHPGYFTRKPSSDRVKAHVVDYDEKKEVYRLEELTGAEEDPLACKMWLI